MSVILLEPVLDLGVLAIAKNLGRFEGSPLFNRRLYTAAA